LIDLSQKTALVCGASQGIGQATAIQMAAAGANVILLARTEAKLAETIQMMRNPEKHRCLAIDLMDRSKVRSEVARLLLDTGPIEILVCNSGGPKSGPLIEATDDEFFAAFENHVLGNSLLAKLLVPGMVERSYGRIINIISTSVKAPIANLGVSNTIRAAVASWAKTLASELAPKGITVNNVLPGYTKTPRLDNLINAAASRRKVSEAMVADEWIAQVPARRFADPREVAGAICFLASPIAGYINGINLPVDGGRTASL
jgi:3-oxoacyl-[acyl-carrier protein] reductase